VKVQHCGWSRIGRVRVVKMTRLACEQSKLSVKVFTGLSMELPCIMRANEGTAAGSKYKKAMIHLSS
jgi:hypothetical protein